MNEILNLLNKEKTVHFYNLFKGVSVSFDGTFMAIVENTATFDVHRYQAVCMRLEGFTLFSGSLFPKPVSAKVAAIDLVKQKALLSEFKYAQGATIGDRTQVRVSPDSPITITLDRNSSVQGDLLEISLGGLGMRVPRGLYTTNGLNPGDRVYLEFDLPLDNKSISMKFEGIVRYKVEKGHSVYRFGIKTVSNPKLEAIILQYISKRQIEIIKEIKTIYDSEVEFQSRVLAKGEKTGSSM